MRAILVAALRLPRSPWAGPVTSRCCAAALTGSCLCSRLPAGSGSAGLSDRRIRAALQTTDLCVVPPRARAGTTQKHPRRLFSAAVYKPSFVRLFVFGLCSVVSNWYVVRSSFSVWFLSAPISNHKYSRDECSQKWTDRRQKCKVTGQQSQHNDKFSVKQSSPAGCHLHLQGNCIWLWGIFFWIYRFLIASWPGELCSEAGERLYQVPGDVQRITVQEFIVFLKLTDADQSAFCFYPPCNLCLQHWRLFSDSSSSFLATWSFKLEQTWGGVLPEGQTQRTNVALFFIYGISSVTHFQRLENQRRSSHFSSVYKKESFKVSSLFLLFSLVGFGRRPARQTCKPILQTIFTAAGKQENTRRQVVYL